MKIISKEAHNKNEIEYILKKDLLIPCWVYKIPIETSKNNDLNFIEKTILDLIQVDESLKNDVVRLSKMLGFHSDDKEDNRTEIIKLILDKIKGLRIESAENESSSEVGVYQFYQEAYGNELLPIITEEINEFSYVEKDYPFKDSAYREISFKQNIHSRFRTKSILAHQYERTSHRPNKLDIIKTIYTHNQNNYQGVREVDFKNFKIDMTVKPELIYLHVKLYIPKNSIKSFVVTNGFTNDFSTTLRKIFEYKHQKLVRLLRQDKKSDLGVKNNDDLKIPFEDAINRYRELAYLIKTIEKEEMKLSAETEDEVKKSKDILTQSLYDLVEKGFDIFSKELNANKTLQDKELLKTLAEYFGFNVDEQIQLSIFNVDSRDNLQKFLAKSLIYKKNELYDLASLFPDLFFKLNKLLELRNGVKHADKENTLKNVTPEGLMEYKDLVYKTISITLKVKQKNVSQNKMDSDDNLYMQNAYIELEDEVSVDIMNKLPQELKYNLTSVNFYLNSIDFNTNKYNIVKEVMNSLYSSFELIMRKIVNVLVLDEQIGLSKDEILNKIRENFEVGESLYRVKPNTIEQALKKKNASLGAYTLVFLYNEKNIDVEDVKLIENIISLRGHGSPSMEDVEKVTYKELSEIKQKSFKYVEKLMEEV